MALMELQEVRQRICLRHGVMEFWDPTAHTS